MFVHRIYHKTFLVRLGIIRWMHHLLSASTHVNIGEIEPKVW